MIQTYRDKKLSLFSSFPMSIYFVYLSYVYHPMSIYLVYLLGPSTWSIYLVLYAPMNIARQGILMFLASRQSGVPA